MAKKIKYSPVLLSNPQKKNEPKKAYAVLQATGTVTTDELIQHIRDHGCAFSEGSISGILKDLVICVQEHLLQGYIVELEPFGKFYPSCSSKGAATEELFTSDNIISYKAAFRPGERLAPATLRAKAQFEKSISKKAADALAKQLADGSITWATPDDDDDDEGGSGSHSSGEILVAGTSQP